MQTAGEHGNEGSIRGGNDMLQASNSMTTGTATTTKDSAACQHESWHGVASTGAPIVVSILAYGLFMFYG